MTTPVPPVPLRLSTTEPGPRRREPVTVGLPWPRGVIADDRHFHLHTPPGETDALQTKVLARWPDGSVRWCLFDFFVTTPDGSTSGYAVAVGELPRQPPADPFRLEKSSLDAGTAAFQFASGVVAAVTTAGRDTGVRLTAAQAGEVVATPTFRPVEVPDCGPVRGRLRFAGTLPGGLLLSGHTDCFAGSAAARFRVTVTNPHPADHPGGNWDLGNGGSVYLDALSVELVPAPDGSPSAAVSEYRGRALDGHRLPWMLHQESSGGENWRSDAHADKSGRVNLAYRGYKLATPDGTTDGLRATPVAVWSAGNTNVGIAIPAFWQNFPMAIHATETGLRLDLLPLIPGRPHELQGGEQKTWRFTAAFATGGHESALASGRSPLTVTAPAEWYATAGALPYLTPKHGDPNGAYHALTEAAMDGPDSFAAKRERIDEYGWRNYGDLYGDHEAVYHKGDAPMVSHNNNQYDCVLAVLAQYLRTSDPRWLDHGLACAEHTTDIDIYHTTGDKPAYNGGLFWHTYHYAPAGTGTHRSYPKALRTGGHFASGQDLAAMGDTGAKLKAVYEVGGGPAGSHNYNAGLAVAYYLTGEEVYREAAVGLADFVIGMDAPRGGVLKLLSGEYSGLATESSGGYHGPGRAAANSVLALVTAHQLTGDRKYLDYAELLIRRVTYPDQDLAALDLLNAELRWFYTMYLQALGVYLDHKVDIGETGEKYEYAASTLLHYATWMAGHERPILDTPDKLQYPTETWAAQDLRKVEVFQYAAKHSAGGQRSTFLDRASYFHKYCADKLHEFNTKSLCRPAVLVLRYGWSHTWWQRYPDTAAPPPGGPAAASRGWRPFVPQKARAVRRAKLLALAAAVCGASATVAVVVWLAR